MIGTVVLVAGFLVVVSTICGILSTFIAHGYLWERIHPAYAHGLSGVAGGAICAGMVFGLFWALNPDPPEKDAPPTVGATATMTGFSALIWLPIYLYSFNAVTRRHRRRSDPQSET